NEIDSAPPADLSQQYANCNSGRDTPVLLLVGTSGSHSGNTRRTASIARSSRGCSAGPEAACRVSASADVSTAIEIEASPTPRGYQRGCPCAGFSGSVMIG